MNAAPKTLPEALNVIRAMHTDLLAFRHPEFDMIAPGREGDFDDRVKSVLAHSAPVIKADRHASDCASDVAIETDIQAKGLTAPRVTPAEIQSGHDRVRWAEGLIRQLPVDHDGRNSWLLNYSTKA